MHRQKLFVLFSLLFLLVCGQIFAFAQSAPHRRALLIGVSEYSRGGNPDEEWWNLNSAPDVAALRQVLMRKFAFQSADIKTLTTRAQTTRQSILDALRDLTARVEAGDIVYLHYSGHGGQVLDDNGDELDGLDESIIPSDYVSRADGSKNIRDDDIGKALDALRAKNPSSITFTFDSCFSGTITRGGRQLVRGESYHGPKPIIKPNTRGGAATDDDATGLFGSGKGTAGGNLVVISATRSDQTAKETDRGSDEKAGKMGALTFALVKALSDAGPQTSYHDLYDAVRNTVESRVEAQTPQIEGNIDTALLSGTAAPVEPFIALGADAQQNIILQAGSLQGMTVGSRFAVFPNGARSVKEEGKIGEAEITELDATTALLRFDKTASAVKIKPEVLATARAFEIEHRYGENLLRVAFQSAPKLARQTEIAAELSRFPLAALTEKDDWDIRLNQSADGAKINLERADGSLLTELKNDADTARNVRAALERETKFRTVRDLENSSEDLKIELRVVPVEVEVNQRGGVVKVLRDKTSPKAATATGSDSDGNGLMQFTEGDFVQLEVRNTGNLNAYITILDLTSDGAIGAMFPHPQLQMPDNKIPARSDWKRIGLPFVFRITPPYGTEIYKMIATPEPADFSPLLSPTIARGGDEGVIKAQQTPLGKILRAATLGQRSALGGAPPPNWATASVSFTVQKKP